MEKGYSWEVRVRKWLGNQYPSVVLVVKNVLAAFVVFGEEIFA
jgi:hypothetical protein